MISRGHGVVPSKAKDSTFHASHGIEHSYGQLHCSIKKKEGKDLDAVVICPSSYLCVVYSVHVEVEAPSWTVNILFLRMHLIMHLFMHLFLVRPLGNVGETTFRSCTAVVESHLQLQLQLQHNCTRHRSHLLCRSTTPQHRYTGHG